VSFNPLRRLGSNEVSEFPTITSGRGNLRGRLAGGKSGGLEVFGHSVLFVVV
jgi:hypothetical protein